MNTKGAFLLALTLAISFSTPLPLFAKGGGGRGGSRRSGSRTSSHAVRPSYGGEHHTTSHGGTYIGASGSSHKGGTYANPRSNDRYGIHSFTGSKGAEALLRK